MTPHRVALSAGIALAGIAAAFAGPAQAGVTYDQNVTNGAYFGSGNPNGGWTLSTDGGYEIGLRAKNYQGLVITPEVGAIPGVINVYNTKTGVFGSGTYPDRPVWNWEFSIDNLGNTGLAGLTAFATITSASGLTNTVDLLPITDNAVRNPAGGTADSGEQNSESLRFGFLPGFSPWYGDSYTFAVSLRNGETEIAADTIIVNAVPEPASMTLFALGLACLGAARRRRR